ncbi:MAG: cell wall metabolism sensor histidine kinase WalK [Weissella confusa]|uniref:cell wall metabolism sensor histidine kinase WalK n=1 Tax=Weissella confusa TaxID=1583 RepID=UPI000DCA6790|nr:cell wall metabolism sensor histidine kinase WalK [Weissella confusa]MBD1491242.1 cell wall metabolism sensor histidine kinase WalK [Weissella confusa]MBD5833547.1 cell wall metabolism sensor histidine kinase WalK [Weissella confusa]MCS9991033.1 cell wall metabolism sensor histidine kinase WalK [Weissella confusa]MCT0025172.1 cell wall metabolism sensor histidine kinase WalK [Weissella confusa]MED4272393.1 cell wall metabolism sensor histidine kinase WalK [Weissella confusa]
MADFEELTEQKRWRKFFSSIHFKIALVFTLTLLVTLELVGAFFVKRLEQQNLATFRTQIALPAYVNDSLTQQLISTDQTKANSDIHTILTSINNASISEIEVIDSSGIIRGTSDINSQDEVGQKTTDANVKAALAGGKYTKNPIEERSGVRYQVVVKPLVSSSGGESNIIGVVEVRASLETTYDNLNHISLIYFSASLLAVVLGVVMAVIISRSLTKPIAEINDRTTRIAQGDYSGGILVRSNDEIGQLAENVNALAVRIEETTNSTEFERRRLDSVLEHMTDGVIATDRRGSINIINTAALQMTGMEDSNVALGQSILEVLQIADRYNLRELLDNQDELLLDFSNEERQLIIRAYFSLIQRASGFISGLVIVLHDVTEQQRIEEERRQFVSNVSHELRTPLTSVKSYVDALQEGAIEDPEVAKSFLAVAQDETTRMIHMINDLLELSRMDSGTMKLETEYVNVGELFNYILNRFDMIIANDDKPEKYYTIKREITNSQIWVELDTSKFTQVVDNIMNNAIKYSPDGGVITARMIDRKTEVVLSITDQGLGIPKKDLGHIFDRFFRVDKARSRAQGGTGLGLAISKEIIERFGGKIWVDSSEGKGSTFSISLPYEAYDPAEDEWDDGEWDD